MKSRVKTFHKEVPVQKTETVIDYKIPLIFSLEEIAFLQMLVYRTGGDPITSPRRVADSICQKINTAIYPRDVARGAQRAYVANAYFSEKSVSEAASAWRISFDSSQEAAACQALAEQAAWTANFARESDNVAVVTRQETKTNFVMEKRVDLNLSDLTPSQVLALRNVPELAKIFDRHGI